ncbi:hypothetical protein DPMN_169934 [Dreissena polymorpha]|uniref:Uncharacterized protein n=1 Tax=Dreissena polymorpha TaxID=45954 RepID=A0A9D4DVA1_DREPO|nr:hypothetical protein DPMN_169934 [Dreissena polymorpha]
MTLYAQALSPVHYSTLQPIEETDFVVSTCKANGEAAHLSCIEVDGEYVLCGGSKNVHLLFKNKGTWH